MDVPIPKVLPSFKERALLHAQGVWNERYAVREHSKTPDKRVYKLIPLKYIHNTRPKPVWVTFVRDDEKQWSDVIVRRGERSAIINVRPFSLSYKSTDPHIRLNYYHARHVFEGWHHDDPDAEIQYICNPPQHHLMSA